MEKEITQEMFEMLTSTIWQDYKGYKRDLNLESPLKKSIIVSILTVIALFASIALISIVVNGDGFEFLLASLPLTGFMYGIYALYHGFRRLIRFSKVNRMAYDIELSDTAAKIIRTRKYKYGIVCVCYDDDFWDTYLRIILNPKFVSIERADVDCFIIGKKSFFTKKVLYGIYNSEKRKITVPVRFDKIFRPKSNANLYIAEINGHTRKYNSYGDRIVR